MTKTDIKHVDELGKAFRIIKVRLSRISLMISSAERLSFQAPAKWSAQPASDFAVFAGVRLFTYFRTLASNVSSLAISPMARYSSAFS